MLIYYSVYITLTHTHTHTQCNYVRIIQLRSTRETRHDPRDFLHVHYPFFLKFDSIEKEK